MELLDCRYEYYPERKYSFMITDCAYCGREIYNDDDYDIDNGEFYHIDCLEELEDQDG